MEKNYLNQVFNKSCKTMEELPDESIDCCVTSPPYWGLRTYSGGGSGLGLEATPHEYVENLVDVMREVRRALKPAGTLWLNLGDTYMGGGGGNYGKGLSSKSGGQHPTNIRNRKSFISASGCKSKDLVGIPWMVAFALRDDGWYLRSDIIWQKPNPMPASITDRPTSSHEYIFLLSKSPKYYYNQDAIREPLKCPRAKGIAFGGVKKAGGDNSTYSGNIYDASKLKGANKRDVWSVATSRYKGAHFATFPAKLIEPCILAGCPIGGIVLDPFMGSGTVAEVAVKNKMHFVGYEINKNYIELIKERLNK